MAAFTPGDVRSMYMFRTCASAALVAMHERHHQLLCSSASVPAVRVLTALLWRRPPEGLSP